MPNYFPILCTLCRLWFVLTVCLLSFLMSTISGRGTFVILMVMMREQFYLHQKILFVLRFYGPVNPMGSCRAWSVYWAGLVLWWLTSIARTDNCPS